MDSPPNFWTPSVTDIFFQRLCAAGTLHRQTYDTHEKRLRFLAGRIGLTSALFAEVNPLDYEKSYMWGWTVPLTPEERSKMEAFRVKN
jgi:hypothetical protein